MNSSSTLRLAAAALALAGLATANAATTRVTMPLPVPVSSDADLSGESLNISPSTLKSRSARPVVRNLQAAAQRRRQAAGISEAQAQAAAAAQPLKIWQYTYTSPRDGNSYSGSIVGSDPRLNGARTTSIPVLIVPLRIAFTGTVRTFDPTKPDTGCLGGVVNTGLAQAMGSPLFNPVSNYTFNGVNMGNVTFIDGFQRAQFWQDAAGGPMVNAKPAFHTALQNTVAATQTVTMANDVNGSGASYRFSGTCGSNANSVENPARTYAFLDVNALDVQLNNIITALNVPPSTFVLFLTYRTYMTDGAPGTLSGNCCLLGYHYADFLNPTNPGHTYGIAGLDIGELIPSTYNTSTLSHEILEWINDPSGSNLVPQWGNIGQVGGCTSTGTGADAGQDNLETGDPMSGLNHAGVVMPNGITYFAQENAFFSWFLGTGFMGAGGKFSSNGTFGGYAKNCPPGGTN